MEVPSYIPWKRALHIDFQIKANYDKTRMRLVSAVPLLVELSSKAVVTSNSLTNVTLSSAPNHVVWDLMKAAIECGGTSQKQKVELLLPSWPGRVLCLRHLWSGQYDILCTPFFYHNTNEDRSRYRQAIQQSIVCTANLVAAFILTVKGEIDTKLRCLDLQGFPTGDSCVRRLASQAIKFHQMQKNRKDNEESKFAVYVDCALQTNITLRVLSRALTLSHGSSNLRLRLVIRNLEMRRLDASIMQLMDQLWDMPVRGLCNECSPLPQDQVVHLFQDIASLQLLVVLDLTLCLIDFSIDAVICQLFADALQSLPALRRLHLNSNILSGRVATLLYRCHQPLEYLSLVSCQLTRSDLEFLAFAPFMSTILELNLSINKVLSDHAELFAGVAACASSIQILNAICCEFADHHLPIVVPVFLELKRLRFLGFSNQAFTSRALIRDLLDLSCLKNLECILLTHPYESYRPDEPDLYDHGAAFLLEDTIETQFTLRRSQKLPAAPPIQFIWSL